MILLLGRLVGQEAKAAALVADHRAHLDAVRERCARTARPRVYFEEWPDPMISGIRWVSELIGIAGGQDVFAERSHGKLAKERFVQPEDVIAARPDVILGSWCGKPVDKEAIRTRAGWANLPAVRNDAIHEIPSVLILQPGPACLSDGLDMLARILSPPIDLD